MTHPLKLRTGQQIHTVDGSGEIVECRGRDTCNGRPCVTVKALIGGEILEYRIAVGLESEWLAGRVRG